MGTTAWRVHDVKKWCKQIACKKGSNQIVQNEPIHSPKGLQGDGFGRHKGVLFVPFFRAKSKAKIICNWLRSLCLLCSRNITGTK